MHRISTPILKAAVPTMDYYVTELPTMPRPKRAWGWVSGGLCPFHDDHHAGNFRVNLDNGAYTCFACGAKGGDVIAFHRARYGLAFREAVNDLGERYLLKEVDE